MFNMVFGAISVGRRFRLHTGTEVAQLAIYPDSQTSRFYSILLLGVKNLINLISDTMVKAQ